MTVSTTNAYSGPLLANGGTKVFPFTFKAMGASEISVVTQGADGSETPVAPALYSVTISGASGGSVTFHVAPANGLRIFILSNPALDQEIEFENESAWMADPHNEGLDRSAVRAQFLAREASRAWREPLGEVGVVVPPALARKGAVLAFDHITGKPIVGPVIATLESVATIAGYLATVAAHVDDIEIVGASIGSVNAVAPVVAAIGVVAANIGLIDAVNDDIVSVRAVGGSITQVRDVAANLTAIGNAASNAAAALAAKNGAEAARDDAVTARNAAATSAATAGNAKADAEAAQSAALAHRNAASNSAVTAAGHASTATGAAAIAVDKSDSASSSADGAALSASQANSHKGAAEAAKIAAEAARATAVTKAGEAAADASSASSSAANAQAAETAAVSAKNTAVTKAGEAAASQLAAAGSATAAGNAKTAAEVAQAAAEFARDEAEAIAGGDFEPRVAAGTAAQYYRGDKSWQTLDKAAVGLGNVANTAPANLPVSDATQAALDDKAGKGVATNAANGLMSAADKAKVDSLSNYTHPTADGSRHVPATAAGDVGKFLRSGASAGAAPSWAAMAIADVANLQTTLNAKADLVGGLIPTSQLPAIAITDTFVVNSQAAMLALTAQVGDMAVRTDLSKTFVVKTEPATVLANWVELLTSTDVVLSVNGMTGIITLTKSHIGLGNVDNTADANKPVSTPQQTALDGKLPNNGGSFTGGYNGGTPAALTGTSLAPALNGGLTRTYTNSAAFTISAASLVAGSYEIDITMTNATGAGAMTPSGFDYVDPDGLALLSPIVVGAVFILHIKVRGSRKTLYPYKNS